jgi:hypothetical protein
VFERPGFRTGSRTIKRGSRVSDLIISFKESSNHCILGIIFLGLLTISYPCEVLELVFILITSSSSSKTDFLWKTCCVFDVAEFTSSSYREVSHLYIHSKFSLSGY